jgi:hypothetical protein
MIQETLDFRGCEDIWGGPPFGTLTAAATGTRSSLVASRRGRRVIELLDNCADLQGF